ncbi:hypothetical protein ABFU27_17185 [Xanthomonas campestris pv. raphani]|uniref:hypothetical protein n=1 Tax=Xanthomonas campestris TaxID=339 RepID=UPI002B2321D6|nr:hypothetical protein [Xanthomonas campestris]MEA9861306.1 hypothetical protein [Xanthomonas campestris pv. raphani]MEA9941215.1 hypothetical protein [Xanthomonas campestris pv. raphani]
MKMDFRVLTLILRKAEVILILPDFSYFYGPIGSGKSSIGRLIDFCLGATLDWTPALQQEFVAARLDLLLNDVPVSLERERDSNKVIASWSKESEQLQVSIPARIASGVALPDTEVQVLSDLLFYLAEEEPPRVRRRKGRPDERMERLSFRDLYRFCYLDQQGMDSDFFKLNSDNFAVKQKSVDALRYILGYQTERVAELESQLQHAREARIGFQLSANALSKALSKAGMESSDVLEKRVSDTAAMLERARHDAAQARSKRSPVPAIDEALRERARDLTLEVQSARQQIDDLSVRLADMERHRNELRMLSVRFQRTSAARTILGGVDFKDCPRCTQHLPERQHGACSVCGQPDLILAATGVLDEEVIDNDLKVRRTELDDAFQRLHEQRRETLARVHDLEKAKREADSLLAERLRNYDSEFLSKALIHERNVATLEQKLSDLEQSRRLPDLLREQRELASAKAVEEAKLVGELEEKKRAAFQDRRNVERLGQLFLDCLVRCNFPDVRETDHVHIDPSSFYPKIPLGGEDAIVVLTFDNAGSGGMMALFRTCFAVALHRLSAMMGGWRLPSVLVIDTATKNVSSVENPEVVQSFYRMIYELAAGELTGTQFVVIDNELTRPPEDLDIQVSERHMVRGDAKNPPLVPYLSGDFFSD